MLLNCINFSAAYVLCTLVSNLESMNVCYNLRQIAMQKQVLQENQTISSPDARASRYSLLAAIPVLQCSASRTPCGLQPWANDATLLQPAVTSQAHQGIADQ
jgi:hypothetical protein